LFGTSPARIDLLNSAAGLFFRIIQDTLWEDVLLHLCRLTDPAEMAKKRNLSLQVLPALCADPILRGDLTKQVQEAVAAATFARDWRNRRIGHRDLSLAMNPEVAPLASASREQVSAAISAVHKVLNAISEDLLDSTLADEVITPATGAETLLNVLRAGVKAEEARCERLPSGTFTQENCRDDAF
jgi:hypothetical protein